VVYLPEPSPIVPLLPIGPAVKAICSIAFVFNCEIFGFIIAFRLGPNCNLLVGNGFIPRVTAMSKSIVNVRANPPGTNVPVATHDKGLASVRPSRHVGEVEC